MKKTNLLSATLAIFLLLCLPTQALAAQWEDFTDVQGHWAENTLQKAHMDGLLTGMSDTELSPDTAITAAQMITLLTRVLGAAEKADTSSLNLPEGAWYAEAAALALHLGLISPNTGNLGAPMRRQDALAMTAKAFALTPAEPDFTLLSNFSDAGALTAQNKKPIAALVNTGLVQGSGGSLNVDGQITRAEFVTILYRIAAIYITPGQLVSPLTGGAVLKGSGSLYSVTADKLWFDCTSEAVSLSNVKAETLTLRGHRLSSFSADFSTELDRLVVAAGQGSLSLGSGPKIGTLQLDSLTSATVGEAVKNIEVTGSGIALTISGSHDSLIVSGHNNTITFTGDARVASLRVTGDGNTLLHAEGAESLSLDRISLTGSRNSLSLKAAGEGEAELFVSGSGNNLILSLPAIKSLDLSGSGAVLSLTSRGAAESLTVTGNEHSLTVQAALNISGRFGGTLNDISLASETAIACSSSGEAGSLMLQAPEVTNLSTSGTYVSLRLKDKTAVKTTELSGTGNHLTAEAGAALKQIKITGSANVLTVDGEAGDIDVSGGNAKVNGTGKAESITINAYGSQVTLKTDNLIKNKDQISKEEVLKLVTTGYKGNFTLKWAEENDYEDYIKEAWINAKGHSSKTDYLLWINLSMQRVNIFKGSAGNWELIRESIVGSGAPKTPTPVGVWTTTYKLASGWNTSSYTCKPVVGFRQGTGYAFHSRLFYPGTTRLKDPGIGYPISAGCIRMYDEDINYIYNNIPNGSTVVVY